MDDVDEKQLDDNQKSLIIDDKSINDSEKSL
jgi:hypothetical protein